MFTWMKEYDIYSLLNKLTEMDVAWRVWFRQVTLWKVKQVHTRQTMFVYYGESQLNFPCFCNFFVNLYLLGAVFYIILFVYLSVYKKWKRKRENASFSLAQSQTFSPSKNCSSSKFAIEDIYIFYTSNNSLSR